ncbi:hypothetical protein AC578_217 [Pseudocercospora eumusae]|uniref:Uncharacterized protein n=1 Tax=Pseudocercospora eumusae TaxID=321146 RepID=A0A139HIZ9_9PEZI|nr:hypothetical protein AC578_217 [Pseudocercospora eumusae]
MKLKFIAKSKSAAAGAALLAPLYRNRYSERVAALCYARGWKRQPPSETQPEHPESTQQSFHDDPNKASEIRSNEGTVSVAQSPSPEPSIRLSSYTATPIGLEQTPESPEVPSSPGKLHYDFQMYKTQFEDAQDLLLEPSGLF